jgi:leucyl/phenylalanyl-tRNA--protein transferase
MNIEEILSLYAQGHFLMDNGNGLGWYRSRVHALIPLDSRFHVPRSLRRALNSGRFESRINADFKGTLGGCALSHGETWISAELKEIYLGLHRAGYAHSFETWVEGELAGGILGIAIGGAFIGESMFYRVPEASKVAMVRLVEHLRARGFELFDAQVQNPHLQRFGAYQVAEREFLDCLRRAVRKPVRFAG